MPFPDQPIRFSIQGSQQSYFAFDHLAILTPRVPATQAKHKELPDTTKHLTINKQHFSDKAYRSEPTDNDFV